jgi:hypothetical protein
MLHPPQCRNETAGMRCFEYVKYHDDGDAMCAPFTLPPMAPHRADRHAWPPTNINGYGKEDVQCYCTKRTYRIARRAWECGKWQSGKCAEFCE